MTLSPLKLFIFVGIAVAITLGLTMSLQSALAGFSAQTQGIGVSANTTLATQNVIWGYDTGTSGNLMKLQYYNGASYLDRFIVDNNGIVKLYNEIWLPKYGSKPACAFAGAIVYDTVNKRPYYCNSSNSWVAL